MPLTGKKQADKQADELLTIAFVKITFCRHVFSFIL
jgi:hypothetical protein